MKLSKLLFLAVAASTLAGCDLPFGPGGGGDDGEIDPKLYELKLTTNLDKAKAGIKAEFKGERDEDEVQELLKAGATQADIDKAGTCVDGIYYFFNQDPVNLYEPFLPGYEFLGWYNGNEWLGYLDPDYDGTPNYIWNMLDKNTTLEARFKLMQFEILYMDEGTTAVDPKGNPTTWNIEDGEVELKHEDKESQGLKFEGWTFAMGGDTRYEGYVTKLNEQFLIDSNVAKQSMEGRESMTFSLHENYSVIKDSFKLVVDTTNVDNIFVEVKEPGESVFRDIIDGQHWIDKDVEATLPRGTEIQIHATVKDPDAYEIDGIYCNGEKVSEDAGYCLYKIVLNGNAEYSIHLNPLP